MPYSIRHAIHEKVIAKVKANCGLEAPSDELVKRLE